MEAAVRAQPLEPPLGELVGLQFGLATAKDLLGFSVLEGSNSVNTPKDLVDPRLGLPSEDDKCATCGGTNYDECTGHFAHVKLTQPIFHPNHMRLLQRTLQKICLGCGVPLVKKKKMQETSSEEAVKRRKMSRGLDMEFNGAERDQPVVLEADPIEKPSSGGVIVLSSDDEEFPHDILRVVEPHPPRPTSSTAEASTSETASPRFQDLRGRGHIHKGKAHSNGFQYVDLISNGNLKTKSGPTRGRKKLYKGTPAGVDVLNADTLETAVPSKPRTCPHCSAGNPEYPPIAVTILPVKGKKKDDVCQILQMELVPPEKFDIASDFWAFVDGPTKRYDEENKVPHKRVLLPSEALNILKGIPETSISKLGMDKLVARPEGLIMECVPVPPNCTRTTDYKYVNNTTAVRFGTDRVTRTLQNLITEIGRIKSTRTGKAMPRAKRDETKVLQILTAEYLREKGAPKAVPGKEPLKKDRNGRVTKQDDHRWTKEWLTQYILGKGGNYTARAVIAGDPSIGVEEIGVPWEISQRLTIPERATKWNCSKLQKYVDRTQTLETFGGPGAMRIVRDGEAFQVWSKSTQKVLIGDIVHRHVQDGDYVYANRPPSVHKHSLMALKVKVQNGLVLTVNPLICPPYNADFDGDIFHIFVPQSLEAMAELEQLMAVQQQILSDQGGHPLLGLTQDLLLAAHLITGSKVLLDKKSMDQLCMWASREPPEAAIVKSPKGGPFWTGEQVFGMTLPADFNLGSADAAVLIKGGDILKWHGDAKMLHKNKDSITGALCAQLGPKALVDYLNSAKGLLHAWLHMQGFSTGLTDFLVTNNLASRQKMLNSIFDDYFLKSIQESCDSIQILDANSQALAPSDMEVDTNTGRPVINPANLTKKVKVLDQAAPVIFRARAADAENIILRYAGKDNSLLSMVKSGSKGSVGKLLQQIAGMGLQLYKGKHLLPFSRMQRHATSDSPLIDWWEDHGFVRSSLVDGLNASELFNHVIADRTGILRKHVEVIQPGTLFKSLMLFLRDLHVMYDGSVRSQCGQTLVQFCYGGAVGIRKKISTDQESGWNQFGMEEDLERDPSEGAGEEVTWEEDDSKRWQLSDLAGEPVGVLAATAIAQPAYELMLDAPNLNGPFKPRPLELVQETLYPRDKSDLKPVDRCVILRLVKCQCTKPLCLERRVLDVQAHLQRITLKMVARSSAIEFWNMDDFDAAGPSGALLRLGSPWLGHIQLSQAVMQHHHVNAEEIVHRLRKKFSDKVKVTKKTPLGRIFFCHSDYCRITNGLCLHFSPKLPPKMQNQGNDDTYNKALLDLLEKIQVTMIPGLLDCTVKGYEQMESVKIVSEGPTWSSWHREAAYNKELDEELVLEVVMAPTGSKSKRNMAWNLVKQACLPIMEMVDWNRSMPYSIQEIRHAMGVEVAYEMVVRRLGLVLEKVAPHIHHVHVKLIADMMTFSGDANGFTFSGYRDMIKSAGISAPFTEASFQKPIRNLLDAAGRGAKDPLEGVMTSCVWGKEAPLGTGTNIDLLWQPPKDPQGEIGTRSEAARDVHLIWKALDEKCIPDKVIPPSPTRSLPDLQNTERDNMDTEFEAGFSPRHSPNGNAGDDADDKWAALEQNGGGEWGTSGNTDHGGWGASTEVTKDEGGWGDLKTATGSKDKDQGGWDSWGKDGEDNNGWGATKTRPEEKTKSGDAWGNGPKETGQGGWGDAATETKSGGGWGEVNVGADEGGGGAVSIEKKSDSGFKSSLNGNTNDEHKSKGWGAEEGSQSGLKTADDLGGWGSSDQENNDAGGWGSLDAVTDKGGWGSNKSGSHTAGASSLAGNTSGWDANPGQESDASGWDSISALRTQGGGWDSFSEPKNGKTTTVTEDPRWGQQDTGAETTHSEEQDFRSGGENRRGHGDSFNGLRSFGDDRGRTSRGRGRGRGGYDRDRGRQGGMPGSGANALPLGKQRQFGSNQAKPDTGIASQRTQDTSWGGPSQSSPWTSQQEGGNALELSASAQPDDGAFNQTQNAGERSPWGTSQSVPGDDGAGLSSGWDAVTTGTTQSVQDAGNWNQSADPSSGQDISTETGGALVADTQAREDQAADGWGALDIVPQSDGWGAAIETLSPNHDAGFRPRATQSPAVGATPRPRRPEAEPECKEIDDIVKSMRRILFNITFEDGARLPEEEDAAVQTVLAYHPKYTEKIGCGIAYIKVDRSPGHQDVRCFWLVRTDGSETDFSFHKCLKEKVAKEFPSFLDRYDVVYGGGRRRRANLTEEDSATVQNEVRPPTNPTEEVSTDAQIEVSPPTNPTEEVQIDLQQTVLSAPNPTEEVSTDAQKEVLPSEKEVSTDAQIDLCPATNPMDEVLEIELCPPTDPTEDVSANVQEEVRPPVNPMEEVSADVQHEE